MITEPPKQNESGLTANLKLSDVQNEELDQTVNLFKSLSRDKHGVIETLVLSFERNTISCT